MLFGEMDAQQVLDDRAEPDAWQAGDPGPEFGVEDAARVEADLSQAGEVLARGVEYPLLLANDLVELGERTDRRGVEQEHPGAATENLDEVGALGVAES
jgi:hypothetical protein